MKSTSEIILDSVISKIKSGEIFDISMSEIANLAEIGKSTIYEYFTSKDDMIYSAVKKMFDDYLSKFLTCSLDENFKDCFYEHISCMIEIAEGCLVFERIFRSTDFGDQHCKIKEIIEPGIFSLNQRVNVIAEKGFAEGVLSSRLSNSDNKIIVTSLVQGLIINFVSGKISRSKEEIVAMLYNNVLKIMNN